MFRNHITQKTELGLLAKSYIDKGQLVPNQITNNMTEGFIKKVSKETGIIFDGFPSQYLPSRSFKDHFKSVLPTVA